MQLKGSQFHDQRLKLGRCRESLVLTPALPGKFLSYTIIASIICLVPLASFKILGYISSALCNISFRFALIVCRDSIVFFPLTVTFMLELVTILFYCVLCFAFRWNEFFCFWEWGVLWDRFCSFLALALPLLMLLPSDRKRYVFRDLTFWSPPPLSSCTISVSASFAPISSVWSLSWEEASLHYFWGLLDCSSWSERCVMVPLWPLVNRVLPFSAWTCVLPVNTGEHCCGFSVLRAVGVPSFPLT